MQFSNEVDIVDIMEILAEKAIKDGGFSFNFHSRQMPESGYAVAVFPGRERIIPAEDFSSDAVIRYANDHAMLLRGRDNRNMLGCWYDASRDCYIMDCSIVIGSLDEAIALGRAAHQKAIYDFAGARDISCKVHENLDYARRLRCLPIDRQPYCGCYQCMRKAGEV